MKTVLNHFETDEAFHRLNKDKSNDKTKVRHYTTCSLAVYDCAFSLLQFLSHKPKISLIRRGHSVIEKMVPHFLRAQTTMQSPEPGQNIISFLQAIDKETNFVLWSSENEITGECLYSDADCVEIHKLLSSKRIFSIQILNSRRYASHVSVQDSSRENAQDGLRLELLKNNYAIVIESDDLFEQQPVTALYTDKFKAPTLIGHFQNINSLLNSEHGSLWGIETNAEQSRVKPNKSKTSLSSTDWDKITQELSIFDYFQKSTVPVKKIQDRFVFSDQIISGDRLRQELMAHGVPEIFLFAPSSLPTWQLDAWKNWWPEAENEKFLRGLLLIADRAFQEKENLAQLIKQSVEKIIRSSVIKI